MIFFLYYLKNTHSYNRFAVSISKRVGSSVQRSYMKRKLRECFRSRQEQIASPTDIWISVKKMFTKEEGDQIDLLFGQMLQKVDHS